jgi:hypothetical protein
MSFKKGNCPWLYRNEKTKMENEAREGKMGEKGV